MTKRWMACLSLLLALTGARAQPVDCPPPPAMPGAQQVQEAQSRARDRGFLWRVSKDGRTHHLYGTIHVGRLDWLFPGPRLRAALAEAQTVAFELDPLDPAVQSALLASGGQGTALPPALATRLSRLLERACLPAHAIGGMHPMMQAMGAMMVEAARDGLQVAFGQEMALAGAARARGLRTVSLETPERQLAALVPADAAQAERYLASMIDQLDSGLARRVLLKLADAWERGDLVTLEGYERWCECVKTEDDRQMLAALNDARNPAMAERIDALHREGARLFVAAGALHMTGPKALPALLRARGYRVERVDFR